MKKILITTTVVVGVLVAGACFNSGVASATCQGDSDYNPNAPLPEYCPQPLPTTTTVVPTTTPYIPTTTPYVPTTTPYIPTTTIQPQVSSAAVAVRDTPDYTG